MGKRFLSELVRSKALGTRSDLCELLDEGVAETTDRFDAIMHDLVPATHHNEAIQLFVTLVLAEISQFDRRVVRPLRNLSFKAVAPYTPC